MLFSKPTILTIKAPLSEELSITLANAELIKKTISTGLKIILQMQ